ncbi:hypothetical protein MMC12_007004 [Toensbergia leucococca]|nr:hypothetical protein [Toensbergia leucococca]
MAHLPRVFRSAVHHQGSFLKFDPTYSSRLGDASGTITNIVFGLLAVFVGVLTVWQAHRAYTLWHTHRSQQLPPASLEVQIASSLELPSRLDTNEAANASNNVSSSLENDPTWNNPNTRDREEQ